jgi:hypothetical protein
LRIQRIRLSDGKICLKSTVAFHRFSQNRIV